MQSKNATATIRRIAGILLILVLVLSMLPVYAQAASSKEYARQLSKGVKAYGDTGSKYSGSDQYYTFTLDTYAQVTLSIETETYNSRAQLLDDFETLEYYYISSLYAGTSYFKEEGFEYLSPGKYYVVVSQGAGEHIVTVNWTARTNTCEHTGMWKWNISATCEKDGMHTRVCTTCGVKEYKTIPAKGHDYSEPYEITPATCTTAGETAQKCNNCGQKDNYQTIPAKGHSWDYGELTTAPDVYKEGLITYTCRTCAKTQEESIAALTNPPEELCVSWTEVPVFDGTAKEPTPIVSYKGKALVEGKDYSLTFGNNTMAGNYAVVEVDGEGDYAKEYDVVTFTIQPADIAQLKDNFHTEPAVYTGREAEPEEIVLKDWYGNVLEEGKEYLTVCSGNVEAGTGKIRVIGLGNFTGSFDAEFTIEKPNVSTEDLTLKIPTESSKETPSYVISTDSKIIMEHSSSSQEDGYMKIDGNYRYNYSTPFTLEPGEHTLTHSYTVTRQTSGYQYVNGKVVWVVSTETDVYTNNWNVTVVDDEPDAASGLIAEVVTLQGSNKLYLSVGSENNGKLPKITWRTTDASIATVSNGIVTLKKPGNAKITATVGDETLSWNLEDMVALTLTKNAKIQGYDPKTGKALVTWKDELLKQGKDYKLKTETRAGVTIVTATGINNFTDSISRMFYEGTPHPFNGTEHKWKDATCSAPKTCEICGKTEGVALGHIWKDATCDNPKICTRCKASSGRPAGHIYTDGVDGTCNVCNVHRETTEKRTVMHMFRMYDPNSGEHFYTGSEAERDFLVSVGWNYEGVGFTFSRTTGMHVYRLYDPIYGEHLYTMDEEERDYLISLEWNLEGIAFNSAYDTEVPQYRLHNPNATRGAYHFTASEAERDMLIALGWEYQGIGFYSSWK